MKRIVISLILFAILAGCGSSDQNYDDSIPIQATPYVNRINPAAASGGDAVTIFGFGFSDVAQYNIVIIDGVTALANAYALVSPPVQGEIESITFTVPTGLAAGAHQIYVNVMDNVSNTNVAITIN